MDFLNKILNFLFKKETSSTKSSSSVTVAREQTNPEKAKELAQLEEQKLQEVRIEELENAVRSSFEALDCHLTFMDNKVQNIAGLLSYEKSLNLDQAASLFHSGIMICDSAFVNPIKISRVAAHYYKNFYSNEKQIKYYNYVVEVCDKYNALEEEINNKYKE